jgi:hypothetical protein
VDKYLVSLAFILLSVECAWLLDDLHIINTSQYLFSSHGVSDSQIPLGKMVSVKKEVRRRTTNSLVWENTLREQNLYAYDSILTLDHSGAVLELNGNSEVMLQENTLVTIDPQKNSDGSSETIKLRFRKGSMIASANRNPQSFDTGDYVIEAKSNSRIAIRSRGDDTFEVETLKGEASVADPNSKGDKRVVREGFALSITGEKNQTPTEALSTVDWKVPQDGSKFYTYLKEGEVDFLWKGEVTSIEIYNIETFKSEIFKVENQNSAKLKLLQGNYQIKLNNQGKLSFARNISVWQAPDIYLLTPVARERFKDGRRIEFTWTCDIGLKNYKIEIAKDPDFQNILTQNESQSTSYSAESLPLGEFYWRVSGEDESGFKIPSKYFNQFFIVKNPLGAPKLKSFKIEEDSKMSEPLLKKIFNSLWEIFFYANANANANAKENENADADADANANANAQAANVKRDYFAEFQWEPVEGADSYLIEVSITPDFREPLLSKTVVKPFFKWKNFNLGTYYWRVAAKTLGGDVGLFSETGSADLKKIPTKPISSKESRPALHPQKAGHIVEKPEEAKPVFKISETPKPLREPKKDWSLDIFTGGDFIFDHFYGGDFHVKESGLSFGLFKIRVQAPEVVSLWYVESELQRHQSKAQDQNSYPFQSLIDQYQFRLSAYRISDFANRWNYGLELQNQETIYSRQDLENVNGHSPILFGMTINKAGQNSFQNFHSAFGFYLGEVAEVNARIWFIKNYKISSSIEAVLNPELKLSTGVTKDGAYFFDAKAILWLGLHF